MEVGMSLNALVRVPLANSRGTHEDTFFKQSLSCSAQIAKKQQQQQQKRQNVLVVQAKMKRGQARQYQPRTRVPPLPKIEDDGNPKFVIFIRAANIYFWYPLSLITGGTTAKIMVAAKDNFLGKYIYKDTITRNIAAVIYNDEKTLQQTAFRQHRELKGFTEFKYGYKLVEDTNLRVALSSNNVIEIPPKDELKTVLDKVKDFFGEAKESFGKLTELNSATTNESKEESKEKPKI